MTSVVRGVLSAAAAALGTEAVRRSLRAAPPGGTERWTRTNHRGEPISLTAGPAATAGLVLGVLVGGSSSRERFAASLAATAAGAFGLLDDLAEDTTTRTKGLRGHLGALARGTVTTGGLKVLGISGLSLVSAALLTDGSARGPASRSARTMDAITAGALIAGTANLVNLLDLRPGRARKAVVLAALPLTATAGSALATSVIGAAAAGFPQDLAEQDMLGDAGANALGALLGAAVVVGTSRPVRRALLAGVLALTIASEKVSFSAVIDRTAGLRELDGWGRRPARLVSTTPADEAGERTP